MPQSGRCYDEHTTASQDGVKNKHHGCRKGGVGYGRAAGVDGMDWFGWMLEWKWWVGMVGGEISVVGSLSRGRPRTRPTPTNKGDRVFIRSV